MSIEDKCNSYIIDNARLSEQLAAAQAREKMLRDALRTLLNHYPDSETLAECDRVRDVVDTALNIPADDTALRAALAAERDRCVTKLLSRHANGNRKYDTRDDCVFAIRVLGDS